MDNPVHILTEAETAKVAGLHSIPHGNELLASKAVN